MNEAVQDFGCACESVEKNRPCAWPVWQRTVRQGLPPAATCLPDDRLDCVRCAMCNLGFELKVRTMFAEMLFWLKLKVKKP
jgi:hypothetical protein